MDNQNPLMNIGDLAKPANTLIEKVADAVEGLAKPFQIKRVAKAQAEANKIIALSDLEITEERQRAMTRWVLEETRRQANMEAILKRALPEITEEAKPEAVNKDWITNFFDKARLISDEDMQTLWAKVLSGQANSPGSYGKRAIEILASLEQSDAILFSKLVSFSVFVGLMFDGPHPLIYDTDADIYINHGVTFGGLSHLESLGLIHFNFTGEYVLQNLPPAFQTYYFDTELSIEKLATVALKMGKVMLTHPGKQLALICDVDEIDDFPKYLKETWKTFGYRTDPNDPAPSNRTPLPDPPPILPGRHS